MNLHERMGEEKAWRHGPGIQEGTDVEKAVLGRATVGPSKIEYIDFRQAVEFTKKHQPELSDRSPTVRKLREKVALYASDKTMPVRFYTAVGTALDFYHGVDAFFEQGNRIATLDISMRDKEQHKADVLLRASMDNEGEVLVSDQEIADVAAQIAAKLEGIPAARAA